MGKKYLWVYALLVSVLILTACGGASGGDGASARAAQVSAGQGVYREQCASCHGDNFEGVSAPALDAANLADHQTGKGLLDYIAANMPLSNPGGLTQDQYLQSTAYILDHLKLLPADQQLTSDNAANIKIQ